MNVWLINHYSLPPSEAGGTRHYDLAKELEKLGFNVTIFASAFNHNNKDFIYDLKDKSWILKNEEGVRFIWVKSHPYQKNNYRRLINILGFSIRSIFIGRKISKLIKEINKPDVIIGCSVHIFAVVSGYILSKIHNSGFFVEMRDLWPQTLIDMGVWKRWYPQVPAIRMIEKFLFYKADRIITLSPKTNKYLDNINEKLLEKEVYIPNGTKVSRFDVNKKVTLEIETSKIRSMFLGSIGYKNGVDWIIDAMEIIEDDHPDLLECFLIGGGLEKAKLVKKVTQMGLSNVTFIEPVPRERVPYYALQADFFILTEREVYYGSSNKLFDYMAAGKPIVTSVFAEHNDIVEEIECGYSTKPGNIQELADKITKMALLSEEERAQMGKRALDYVLEYHDYSVLANKLAEAIDNIYTER